jgi:putative DNA-invertase from lambdoid prophage Rac
MKKQTIAVYSRVSTVGQKTDSQLREVRSYIKRRWPKAEVREFSDTASGSKFTREGLDALMEEVRSGKIETVAIYKLDRLGRSLQHLAQLIGEFERSGVSLVATSQGIDTSHDNPAGRLQMNVLAAVAEFERGVIVERVRAGLDAAKARGVKLGRPASLAAKVPEVRRLLDAGLSVRKVAAELDIPVGSASKLCREVRAGKDAAGLPS